MRVVRWCGALAVDVVAGAGAAGLLLGSGFLGLRAFDVTIPYTAMPSAFMALAVGCSAALVCGRVWSNRMPR